MASTITVSPTSGSSGTTTHTVTVSGEHTGTAPVTHIIEYIPSDGATAGQVVATSTITRAGRAEFSTAHECAFYNSAGYKPETLGSSTFVASAEAYPFTKNESAFFLQIEVNRKVDIFAQRLDEFNADGFVRCWYKVYDSKQATPTTRLAAEQLCSESSILSVNGTSYADYLDPGDTTMNSKYICMLFTSGSQLNGKEGIFYVYIRGIPKFELYYKPAVTTLKATGQASISNPEGSTTITKVTADGSYTVRVKQ